MRLHIADPCHEDWSAMTPNGPGRHCASCDKTVLDLTALTAAQSSAALAAVGARVASGEKLCVRGHADARGRLTATRARRRLLTNGMAAMLAVAMAGALSGCTVDGGSASTPRDPATTASDPAHPATRGSDPPPQPLMGAPAPQPQAVEPHPLMGKVAAPRIPSPRMGEAVATATTGQVVATPAPVGTAPGCFDPGWHQEPEPQAALMGDVCMPEPARSPTPPPATP